jgi:hypothetical protein
MSDQDTAPDTSPTGEPAICVRARGAISCEDDDTYRKVVDPAGPYAEEIQVAHAVSSCMCFAAWLIGWDGRFVADTIQNVLRRMWGGTGRKPDADNVVSLGAQVWWAASATAPEHVDGCVVGVERTSEYVVTLTVIAGGQRVTQQDIDQRVFPQSALGKRCIKKLLRSVVWTDGVGWVDQGDNRHILGVHDLEAA